MIRLIYGPKGTGKTKQIIEAANAGVQEAKGDIVFIDKNNGKMHEISSKIRLVDAAEYGIKSGEGLAAFIKGLMAGNRDIETVYIDGIAAITGLAPEGAKDFYGELERIGEKFGVYFVVTVSTESLPEFLKKFAVPASAGKKSKSKAV